MARTDWRTALGNILADAAAEAARVAVGELRNTINTPRGPADAPQGPSPYAVLGVAEGASLEDCEAMFRHKSKGCHPDRAAPGDVADRVRREAQQKVLGEAIAAIRARHKTAAT